MFDKQAYMREWRRKNRKQEQARYDAWRVTHPEQARAASNAWKLAHPGHNCERRALGKVPRTVFARVLASYGGRCMYCDAPATTIDHFVPIKLGGTNKESNLAPACLSCNSSKGAKDPWDWEREHGVPLVRPFTPLELNLSGSKSVH